MVALAVTPDNPRPGLHLAVDLTRGSSSPGAQGLRALIVTPPETGQGNATLDTEVRPVFSKEDVLAATGRSLGYYAYKALFANDSQALVDLIACTGSSGSVASATLTFSGAPVANSGWLLDIQGTEIEIEWNVGETDDDAALNAVARVNAKGDDIYVIAGAVNEVVTFSARAAGPAGNDVRVSIKKLRGDGATATLSGSALTGGTTEVDMTAALATARVKEYDYILLCMSNADAQSGSASSNPARLKAHINDLNTGARAKLQQGIVGSTGTRAQAKVNALAINEPTIEHACSQLDRSLPCEVAAAELGDRMRRRRRESNANRILQPIRGLRGAADKTTQIPTDAQFADAVNNGVTVLSYTANGEPMLERSVTTYSKDTLGNQDTRARDTNEIDAIYDYFKDLRAAIPQEFMSPDGQVKITRDLVPGDDPPPERVVEERDVKAFIRARTMGFWVPRGVIDGAAFQAAYDNGELICRVNNSDETQLDVFLPVKAFKALTKIGLYGAKVG